MIIIAYCACFIPIGKSIMTANPTPKVGQVYRFESDNPYNKQYTVIEIVDVNGSYFKYRYVESNYPNLVGVVSSSTISTLSLYKLQK